MTDQAACIARGFDVPSVRRHLSGQVAHPAASVDQAAEPAAADAGRLAASARQASLVREYPADCLLGGADRGAPVRRDRTVGTKRPVVRARSARSPRPDSLRCADRTERSDHPPGAECRLSRWYGRPARIDPTGAEALMVDGTNAGGSHHGEISAAHLLAGAPPTSLLPRCGCRTRRMESPASTSWIVLDGLWRIAKLLIPAQRVRPQGGGRQGTPDETLFAAIVSLVCGCGCGWRRVPLCFDISKSTAHRRFLIWSRAGVWGRPHGAVLHWLDGAGFVDVTRVSAHPRVTSPPDVFRPEAHSWRPWSSTQVRTTPRLPASAIHGPPASSAPARRPARTSCPGLPKGFRSARSTPVTVSSTSGHRSLPGCGESA